LTDKGCRVLTIEEARLRKRRADEKLEADVWKQQCLEKRQEKAFEQAIIESPMGSIYEAQAVESLLFQNNELLSGSDTGRVFGWKFSSPSFLLSHPKIDLNIISIRSLS